MSAGPLSPPPSKKKRSWTPHIWQGIDFFAWIRLLACHRCAVHWSKWYVLVVATIVSTGHTLLRWVQDALFGRAIRKTQITQPPIFIVGHWRTGTTLLHELMVLDPRHGYPTTYECLEPNHFLLTEGLVTRFLWFLLPSDRSVDNMKVGFARPQEDEFAMCMMGEGSPYLDIAFPNRAPQFQEYLDFAGVPHHRVESWKRGLLQFMKRVSYKTGKRLVLKSPAHAARIPVLKDLFPGSVFIHIVRNPYAVYPSTVKLWKYLYNMHGLQRPTYAGLEERVLDTFVRLYERLEEGKRDLEPQRFFEMRYEDLVRDPEAMMKRVYDHFGWGGWEAYAPRLRDYLASIKDYETNKFEQTPAEREMITKRWGAVIERYGYKVP